MLMYWRQKWHTNQQWRVWCEESGGWEYQKKSREYWRVCKVIDGHIAKTEQSSWYIYSRECLSCTEFFVGLGASGEIKTEVWCSQFYIFLVQGEQHSSVCDKGYGQQKQAGPKGENYSSQDVTMSEVTSFTVASVERYFHSLLWILKHNFHAQNESRWWIRFLCLTPSA